MGLMLSSIFSMIVHRGASHHALLHDDPSQHGGPVLHTCLKGYGHGHGQRLLPGLGHGLTSMASVGTENLWPGFSSYPLSQYELLVNHMTPTDINSISWKELLVTECS